MSTMRTKDIYDDIESFLTEDAIKLFSQTPVRTLTGVYNDGEFAVKQLGVITKSRTLGAMAIAQLINNCVAKYKPISYLAKPLQMQVDVIEIKSKFASVVLMAFPEESAYKIDKEIFSIKESGIPQTMSEDPGAFEEALKNGMRNLDEEAI